MQMSLAIFFIMVILIVILVNTEKSVSRQLKTFYVDAIWKLNIQEFERDKQIPVLFIKTLILQAQIFEVVYSFNFYNQKDILSKTSDVEKTISAPVYIL